MAVDLDPPLGDDLLGGGSGAGVSIRPVAFLVIKDGLVRTIQLSDPSNSIDRALTMLPELVDRLMALIPDKKAAGPQPQDGASGPEQA